MLKEENLSILYLNENIFHSVSSFTFLLNILLIGWCKRELFLSRFCTSRFIFVSLLVLRLTILLITMKDKNRKITQKCLNLMFENCISVHQLFIKNIHLFSCNKYVVIIDQFHLLNLILSN